MIPPEMYLWFSAASLCAGITFLVGWKLIEPKGQVLVYIGKHREEDRHHGYHTRPGARLRQAEEDYGEEEGRTDRERREDEGRPLTHGEEGRAHQEAARKVRILLEGGPFAGDEYEITEELFRSGRVRLSERVQLLASVDMPEALTVPRTHVYARQLWANTVSGEKRYRWLWESQA